MAFGIVCVIVCLLFILGPALRRWLAPLLQRWMMGKMEDRFRSMAGMPTRKEEKRMRKEEEKRRRQRETGARGAAEAFKDKMRGYYGSRSTRTRHVRSTIGLLQYVAEDVEFTEIREFGSDSHIGATVKAEYHIEEQIEDVEFTEIKTAKTS